MAPRKGKTQGKRNKIKIKSKINRKKRGSVLAKKTEATAKPMESPKWLNKAPGPRGTRQCGVAPTWPNGFVYKHTVDSRTSDINDYGSDYASYTPKDEDRSSITEDSEECNCSHSNFMESPKGGILKRKVSSTNNLVAKYLKTGMDQVASFIVETAIRFGEKHGVVVPDKKMPNVYEIVSPDRGMAEKCRKIRFKVPEKERTYENKRLMWEKQIKNARSANRRKLSPSDCNYDDRRPDSKESASDSLDEIIPLLEKLEKGGAGVVSSELDLNQFAMEDDGEELKKTNWRMRTMDRTLRNVRAKTERSSDREYPSSTKKENHWKKFRRDSLELGRRRLRASSCPKRQPNDSPSPY